MKTYKMYSEKTKQIEDFTTKELILLATKNQRRISKINDKLSDRRDRLIYELEIMFNNANAPLIILPTFESKPAKGASYSVIVMKNKYRINYRCGYSRFNYAPVIEIAFNN